MQHNADGIPSPPGLPLVGNIMDLQDEVPIHALERLIDQYGPIVRIRQWGGETVLIGSVALLEEISDDTKFWKTPAKSLTKLRSGPRGLFASENEDDVDWQIAHRILMPAFGPLTIQEMFDEMYDIASQLVLKLARQGSACRVSPTSEFTKLTLDTIALCAMGYRFNSFYHDELHSFVKAMNNSLATASDSSKIGPMLQKLLPWDHTSEQARADGEYMLQVGQELVQYRRDHPTDKMDLLNHMINGKDPIAGKMSDGLIGANMVSFLVAGHETTSGLLSFAFILLLQHPETYRKVQEEVDRVVGCDKLCLRHLKDLHYINAVLRETLRLHPTAPAYIRSIRSSNENGTEQLGGGKYTIKRSDQVVCLSGRIQRDPAVYEDPDAFKPERMLDENFTQLPNSAWKPFGTGVRSCIGRPFAWQEAQICLALMFRHLDFEMDDPQYEMKVKQTLTIKPSGFFMRTSARHGCNVTELQANLFPSPAVSSNSGDVEIKSGEDAGEGPVVHVLYGSMTGTCKSIAQRLAVTIRRHGSRCELRQLDVAVAQLPSNQPVVIVTPSYEGEPPDNAKSFFQWLQELGEGHSLRDVRFAVFGVGHSDWKNTLHRVPKLIDELMGKAGAFRLVPARLVDVAADDIMSEVEIWYQTALKSATRTTDERNMSMEPAFSFEVSSSERARLFGRKAFVGSVTHAKRLTSEGIPEKRHLELEVPEGFSYRTGDYLTVLPMQPMHRARQVCRHFEVPEDAVITIKGDVGDFVPTNRPTSVLELLRGYYELTAPASKTDLAACVQKCSDAQQKAALEAHIADEASEGAQHGSSLLSILVRFPAVDMSLTDFLVATAPLKPRYYSISSSSMAREKTCSITYSASEHGVEPGFRQGVSAEYLSKMSRGDMLLVSVDGSNERFRLPAMADSTPIIMLCAGTGLAPFRAFVQERSVQKAKGQPIAAALLLIGCRNSGKDRLYADEIDTWTREGVVEVRYAYSQTPEHADGCRYVQDRLWRERERVVSLWQEDALVLVCGGRKVTKALASTASQILQEAEGMTPEEAGDWLSKQRNDRIVVESFG